MKKRKNEPHIPTGLLGRELSTAVVLFHEAIASHLGISATEWKCLGVLTQMQPATAGRLAQSTGLTTGAITGILDRLERAGFVRREPNPNDRRSVLIRSLREKEIQDKVAPVFQSLQNAMTELSRSFSPSELAAIHDYFSQTIEALRSETAKLNRQKLK
jgi:DNA-binding MarR family transcriptional regulator